MKKFIAKLLDKADAKLRYAGRKIEMIGVGVVMAVLVGIAFFIITIS